MTQPGDLARHDYALSDEYRKDPLDEHFLRHLNDIIAPHEESLLEDIGEPYPTIHVVGAPRSGTTLLTQLISRHLDVGCINNLIAAFYRAPIHGIRLSKKLLGDRRPQSLESTYGRTQNLTDPHEFGYFWAQILNYQEQAEPSDPAASPIDWNRLRLILTNMTAAQNGALVFKSFVTGFYARQLHQVLPKTILVHVRRNTEDNAHSILRMRREYSGSVDNWVGVKPNAFTWLRTQPPPVQAVGQVLYVEAALRAALSLIDQKNVVDVEYESLCMSPLVALERVLTALHENGHTRCRVIESPQSLQVRPCAAATTEERNAVRRAIHRIRARQAEAD